MKSFFLSVLVCCVAFLFSCKNSTEKSEKNQTEKVEKSTIEFVKKIQLSGNTELAFAKHDTIFDLYYEPFLIVNYQNYLLEGFDNINRSAGDILGFSPNGNYFVMDYLSIGYVDKEGENVLHENYFCVVVDVLNKRILHQMQSDCDGEWNGQNQWISGEKVVVSFD
jgi:hypothetical protein